MSVENINWCVIVSEAINSNNGKASVGTIYDYISLNYLEAMKNFPDTWKNRIRHTLSTKKFYQMNGGRDWYIGDKKDHRQKRFEEAVRFLSQNSPEVNEILDAYLGF